MNINFGAFSSVQQKEKAKGLAQPYEKLSEVDRALFIGNEYEILEAHLGTLHQNEITNFWTLGRYAMQDVLKYVVKQIGPCDVTACTWAITRASAESIVKMYKSGAIRSFRIWIDPRVKVRNPEPLAILKLHFPVVIAPVHAKVTCCVNDQWHVSISGSLNFTSNPQPERGTIQTFASVCDADLQILSRQFQEGNVETPIASDDFADASEQYDAMVQGMEPVEQTYHGEEENASTDESEVPDKRKAWRKGEEWTVPRCNMVEKVKYHQRAEMSIISAYERSEEGYEINVIKSDFRNVVTFADVTQKILRKLIGDADRSLYALVVPPKRRHKTHNFAESIAMELAKRENLHFYPDALTCYSKHRIGAVFNLEVEISEPMVIIFDDIFTTGSTLTSCSKAIQNKGKIFLIGIYNN